MPRTSRASLALSVVVLPLVLAAPVVSFDRVADVPEPVPAQLHTLPLTASAPAGSALRSAQRVVHLPARATEGFSTVGVTWAAGPRPDVEVFLRTRTEGAWTGWVDLEGQTDDGPDVQASRAGTRPVYVGPSDGVEVKVEVLSGAVPADLRVDLVDPGTSPADARRASLPRGAVEASEPQPDVVTRAEWGADESIRRCTPGTTGTPRVAFVHHTASTNDYSPEEAPAAVRGFYAYHVKSNGWCDIGYNFLVDRYGVVYEGRYGGIDRAVLGAHTGGFNANSFGTAMIGDFSSATPPAALRTSLARLLAWKLGRSYADPSGTARLTAQGSGSRFRAGTTQTFDVVSGHRDAGNTSCPGEVGYGVLEQLREDVRAQMGTGFVAPSASPDPTTSTPVQVDAGLLTPLDWRLEVAAPGSGAVVRRLRGSSADAVRATWDLRDDAGLRVAPGDYRLTLSGGPAADPAHPWSTTVTVQAASGSTPSRSPAPVRTTAAPAALRGAAFVPVRPARVLDTRKGTGGRATPLGPSQTHDLVLAWRAGVPAGAVAVAVNLTGTGATSGTHLTVWPAGRPRPDTAVLNLRPGATAASLVVAGLGARGATSVRNLAGTTDVVADVVGYWTRSGGAHYRPLRPARLLDTRLPAHGGRKVADQETRRLAVRGRGGVPASATAVALNVTAVGPVRPGYVTVTPAGVRGATSSLNVAGGEPAVPNRVITGLSSGGAVDLFVAGTAHLLVDVVGWYGPAGAGGSLYTPLTPSRLVDSRVGTGTPKARLGPRTTRDVQVTGARGVPAGATAVVLSLTGTGPSAPQTHLTAFADGTANPGTSDLNLTHGATRSNLAIVPLSRAGRMSLYNEGGTTHVVADVLGYYAPR